MSVQVHKIDVTGTHVPEQLKEADHWVTWLPGYGKTARAPWQSNHMYPAEWAEGKDVDPRRSYDKAASVASIPTDNAAETWAFPNDVPVNDATIKPAVLLPAETDYLFVDFDDVVKDGEVTQEVWDIIQRLGGYAEVSVSFDDPDKVESGIHVWVRGSLPERLGKFIEPLDDRGQIEMYDHGRMTGGTWRHIEGTPKDAVPDAQDVIDELVARYERAECASCETAIRKRMLEGDDPDCPRCGESFYGDDEHKITRNDTQTGNGWNSNQNPYYQLDVCDIADTGAFRSYRNDVRNPAPDEWQGPHPKHGGTSTADKKSTNFHVDPTDGVWHCFAHDSGGGALSLIAVLEGIVSCRNAAEVHRDRDKLLQACIAARNNYATDLDGETPPYNALLAVASHMDLDTADETTLGRVAHSYATDIYHAVEDYAELVD